MKTNSLSDLALYLGQEAQRLESIIAKYQARAQNSMAPVRNLNNPTIKQMEQNSYYDTIAYFEQLLCQVQFAQERLATGLYGICVECSQSISAARLDEIPYATSCVQCESHLERTKNVPRIASAIRR